MKRGPSPAHLASSSGSLTGMSELHDLSFEYQIVPLLRLLSQEAELIDDLTRVRPWLATEQTCEEVLSALLEQEWAGFVARLGRLGPWVFAPSVADLQALSGGYSLLVECAMKGDAGQGDTVLGTAGQEPSSLLGRLRDGGALAGREPSDAAGQAEADFWTLAGSRAARQRQEWATRREQTRREQR